MTRAAAAKEMLKAAGQQVVDRQTARRATDAGARRVKDEPLEPISPSARLTSVTVNRRPSEKKRRATLDPSAERGRAALEGLEVKK